MNCFLIIGATGYIGSALTKALKTAGHTVHGSYLDREEKAQATLDKAMALNLFKKDSLDQFLQEVAPAYDGVVFCPGLNEKKIMRKGDIENKLSCFDEDLAKSFVHAWAVHVPYLLKNLSVKNNIVFIGSLVGKKSLPMQPEFALGKSLILGLVDSLSKDLGRKKICVNSLAPGILKGGVGRWICEQNIEAYLKHCALSRLGSADEVAALGQWLLTKNTYITGKHLSLDGGL